MFLELQKNTKLPELNYFSSIDLSKPCIEENQVKSQVVLHKLNSEKKKFIININYEEKIGAKYLPLLQLAFFIPLLNYSLFTKEFKLDFNLTRSDITLLNELNRVFSRDIFINKIMKGKSKYIIQKKLFLRKNINSDNEYHYASINPLKIVPDKLITEEMDQNSYGVLSSGGKESLLTYCMIKELGYNVYPLYVNESGGHWRTALSAYNYHKKTEINTRRIWTNVDRFYNFMLDNLDFIRPDHRTLRTEAYPIRTCIFPFYVFSLLPIFADKKIGNLLIGSEFDDLDYKNSSYDGLPDYYGVYDQHQDYDILMNTWYTNRIPGIVQWSALRNITGLIVEKILLERYPKYAKYQRSCHSCHIEKNDVFHCGKCSKCLNILLFLFANNADPKFINFKEEDIIQFYKRINPNNLKLDYDEKNQSFFIGNNSGIYPKIMPADHLNKFHINPDTCDPKYMPLQIRNQLINIIKKYTNGYCILKNKEWIDIIEKEIKVEV